jgi:hypothetical protein
MSVALRSFSAESIQPPKNETPWTEEPFYGLHGSGAFLATGIFESDYIAVI